MLDTYRQATESQFHAALWCLSECVDFCADSTWNAPVVELRFCQIVFHTLFFTDYYLGDSPAALRDQPFHREHPDFFRDYEELQSRRQEFLYDKPSTRAYLDFCRRKVSRVLRDETVDTLAARCDFHALDFSRAELHAYNLRHIEHHAAQLRLWLKIGTGQSIPWSFAGWPEQ